MKKTLSLLIVAIIALASSINASAQWTDRNTFNLKGPVKAIEDQFNCEFLEFEENGDIIFEEDPQIYWARVDRDNKGRITYMGRMEYIYNNKGQVSEAFCSAGGGSSLIKYTYNSKGQVIKQVAIEHAPSGRKTTSTTTYTYQKFDKYGNWIKRTAKTGKKRTVETRTITYYE